jgi:hypothetical protein
MRTFIQKTATWKNILILMGIMLLFEFLFFPAMLPKGEHAVILDTSLAYNGGDAYKIIENYDAGMRQSYIFNAVSLDLIFPVIYTLLFAFAIYLLFGNSTLALLPFLQMLFDYLENTGIVIMLSAWPNKFMWMATCTSVFSMIKWSLVGISTLIILVGGVRFLISRNKPLK